MGTTANPLGTFLRARRERVTPQQAGVPNAGARRVPGLRREEVALLAGISADYYLRLEQGRDRNPSPQVLEALARVLLLDDDQFAHLVRLVTKAPQRRRRPFDRCPPIGAVKLLSSIALPAFIENQYFDVLASNALARAVNPRHAVGGNQLRDMFLDPAARDLYPDWAASTECLVANLRQAVGNDVDDPRFIELTEELSLASPRFRQLWARNEVRRQAGSVTRFNHPQVGQLNLNRERMSIDGADGMMLVVFHPEPGSSDAAKLTLLASAAQPRAAADKVLSCTAS